MTERAHQKKTPRAGQYKRLLANLWSQGKPVSESLLATRYFQGQQLDCPPPGAVRFHPAIKVGPSEGERPGLLCRVSDADGQPVTLQRVFLDEEGNLAAIKRPKRLMPAPDDASIDGGAIRLSRPRNATIGVAVSLEAALAVERVERLPMWATVTHEGLRSWLPPLSVANVAIWSDADREGYSSAVAQQLRERLWAWGYHVAIYTPHVPLRGRERLTWRDVLLERGVCAFPELRPQRLNRAAAVAEAA